MATNKQKTIKEGAFVDDKSLYGKKTKTAPRPETQIGIDQKDTLLYDIADAGLSSLLDLSAINGLKSDVFCHFRPKIPQQIGFFVRISWGRDVSNRRRNQKRQKNGIPRCRFFHIIFYLSFM